MEFPDAGDPKVTIGEFVDIDYYSAKAHRKGKAFQVSQGMSHIAYQSYRKHVDFARPFPTTPLRRVKTNLIQLEEEEGRRRRLSRKKNFKLSTL